MATLRAQSQPGDSDSPDPASPSGAARELRNYRLDRRIGQDELAIIYRATHLTLDRPVLVSVLRRTDWVSSSRFQLAARLAAHLTHPNLLPVIDAGHDDHIGHYLVTPYLDTRSLQDVLANGALDPVQALRIATQLASVLDYLHAQNVVHRDVQPANILITLQGTVYLTNLSLAASPDTPDLSSIDDTDYRTPYTAPEQTLRTGQPTPASDLYSLGAVIYHMLSGDPPPPTGAPPSLALRDEALAAADRVIQRLMAAQPSHRYSSAGQAIAALRQALRPQIDAATVDMEESRWEPIAEWLENPLETVLGSMIDADFVTRSRIRADTLHRVDAVRRLLDRWSRQSWMRRRELGHVIEPEQIISYNLYFYELRVAYETRTMPQSRFSVHRGGALAPAHEAGVWDAPVPDVPPFETHGPETLVIPGSQRVVGCPECSAAGRIPCRTCSGSGTVMRTRKVKEPDGSARIEQFTEECPTCRGYAREECENCEGTGQLLEEKVFDWSRHARAYFNEDDLSGLHKPTLQAKALRVFEGPISLREGHWYQVAPLKEMIEEAQRYCKEDTRIIAAELTIRGVPVTEVDYRFRGQPRTLAFIGFDNTLRGDSTLYDVERLTLYAIILIMAIILVAILILR
ncbi:MAG: protein kinase [Roseiflexus sp.]|nr:protein kinase [Roseiflexus sp.]MCS7287665.1 protein kinase [Roseiflexus sp.]MDW8147862.1 protein kinase [Roseiflexaceae bacterium]MDW8233680.1 protein kinase [Roseiflexaceae bacterium]